MTTKSTAQQLDEARELITKQSVKLLLMRAEMDIIADDPTGEPARKILDRYRHERAIRDERGISGMN